MTRTTRRMGIGSSILALTTASVLAVGGVAYADNIQHTIADAGTSVTLVAGSGVAGSAMIHLIGNSAQDPDAGCNIDPGEAPLVLDIITPPGVTANPDPLSITSCGTEFPVTFTAGLTAVSGHVTVTIQSGPAGEGTYKNQVDIPITIVSPQNTKPTVAVTGVTDGATYEIGSAPVPGCAVTDAEDTDPTAIPVVTGALVHGLGSQTATCDYTDAGGLEADTASATYEIVDTGDPTIQAVLDPASPNGSNGWYKSDVKVDFVCADVGGSGVDTCTGDVVLDEGADQSATGTATDFAGNTASATVSNIDVDKTAPTIVEVSGVSDYFYGSTPGTASCTAVDGLSGLDDCTVTGFGETAVGAHSATATATDVAGNQTIQTVAYEVKAWTRTGFYAPVDMGGVLNIVKAGSTVPLKFEVFGDAEFTATSVVKSFIQRQVTCGTSAGTDDIEFTTTGKTELRYDAVAGQFIQNWQTPKAPAGTCYVVTMTLQDGVTTLVANFRLK